MDYCTSVSNSSKWNIQSLINQILKDKLIGFSGKNIVKFIDYKTLANTLILTLKWKVT